MIQNAAYNTEAQDRSCTNIHKQCIQVWYGGLFSDPLKTNK